MIINRRALLAAIGLSIPAIATAEADDPANQKKKAAKKAMKPAANKATAHKAPKAKTSGAAPTQG